MGEWEERRGRITAYIFSFVFIILFVGLILYWGHEYEVDLQKEAALKEQLEQEEDRRAELQDQADELCRERLVRYTENGVVQLDQFLMSYHFTPTETGWVSDDDNTSKLVFTFGDEVSVKYTDKDGKLYSKSFTKESKIDNYSCKIGAQTFTISQDDATALGRVVVGDTSFFREEE